MVCVCRSNAMNSAYGSTILPISHGLRYNMVIMTRYLLTMLHYLQTLFYRFVVLYSKYVTLNNKYVTLS
jgi:hypothetical protein